MKQQKITAWPSIFKYAPEELGAKNFLRCDNNKLAVAFVRQLQHIQQLLVFDTSLRNIKLESRNMQIKTASEKKCNRKYYLRYGGEKSAKNQTISMSPLHHKLAKNIYLMSSEQVEASLACWLSRVASNYSLIQRKYVLYT